MIPASALVTEAIPLHRLLKRREAESLLAEYQALLPGSDVALVGVDGAIFAGARSWPQADVAGLLAGLQNGATTPAGGARALPIVVNSRLVAALIARPAAEVESIGQEGALRGLRFSLQLLLEQALERREVASEAIERYRELNLLYNISGAIGARLDPNEIPGLVLTEACRVIRADVAAVLLESAQGGELHIQVISGEPSDAHTLVALSQATIDQVWRDGRPAIIADLAARPIPVTSVLCAPLKATDRVIGAIVMGRLGDGAIFTAGDAKLLMALAGQAAIAIEKAWLHREELERQRLEEELAVGRRIQLSLLPHSCPTVPGWEFAAYYQAARQVGGDLYDFFELPGEPRRLGLVIADVTGKGVAAALFMAVCRTVLRIQAMTGGGPADALSHANRFIAQDFRSGLLLSAFYAILDIDSGRLTYANGGHNWPLWLDAHTGECRELSARGILLGTILRAAFEERRIDLAPGDTLVFYTDGVTEAMNSDHRMFDDDRLRATLLAARGASAEQTLQAIVAAVIDFTGDMPQSDDLTLFVVKRQAQSTARGEKS